MPQLKTKHHNPLNHQQSLPTLQYHITENMNYDFYHCTVHLGKV
jgi:hypothetical protein